MARADQAQLLAALQALGPLNLQQRTRRVQQFNGDNPVTEVDESYMDSDALRNLLGPQAAYQLFAKQSHGSTGGDNAAFYDDPSLGHNLWIGDDGGGWIADIGADGTVGGLRWKAESNNLLDKIGGAVLDYGWMVPLLAAGAGAGLFGGGAAGGAGAAGGSGAPISGFAAPQALVPGVNTMGAVGGAELGSGMFGLDAAVGQAAIPFGGLTGAPALGTAGQIAGQMAVIPGAGVGMNALGAAAAAGGAAGSQPAAAAQPAVAPQSAAVTPAAKTGESLLTMDNARMAAQLAGPAMSLLSAPRAPQMPGAPVVPGAAAPPEARGFQASRAPILDVLGRNRRAGRNQTLLTGPRGVNMDSVRVGGNSLLGL